MSIDTTMVDNDTCRLKIKELEEKIEVLSQEHQALQKELAKNIVK